MRFAGKSVVVIGGNSGIGRATAEAFATEGAAVVVCGRDEATLRETEGPNIRAVQANIADLASLDALYAGLEAIDILVVNAGIGTFTPLAELTPEAWDETQDVNLRGCVFAVQKALSKLQDGGAIVFTGSIGAILAIPGNAAYAASKAGLRAAARVIGAELIGRGIRVNMVSPGPIETPILGRGGFSAEQISGLKEMMIANTPMRRMGEADEVARSILFLASDEASFITGVDLFVDGGAVELG